MPIRNAPTRSIALILACAAVWMWPAFLAARAMPRIGLTVRVYQQTTGLPLALQKRALTEAETVLLPALVDVHWEQCSGPHSAPGCQAPPGPAELLLVVRERSSCEDRAVTLGEALIIQRASGLLASVYVNCVASLAAATETDVAVLFGRVVAHELGHLMMRSAAHAHRGLMRRNWTPDEIRRNHALDWTFTAEDVAAMRQPGSLFTTLPSR